MRKLFAVALFAVLMGGFTSCNKLEKELSGTTWTANQDLSLFGTDIDITTLLTFTDKSNCDTKLIIAGIKDSVRYADTVPLTGTYTYANKKGAISIPFDEETYNIPFTYDSKNNTIAATVHRDEEEATLYKVTLTQQK